MRRRTMLAAATATAAVAFASPLGALAQPGPGLVADGLNNPRQLALDSTGALYVAEAGSGGRSCRGRGEERQCVGLTSSITQLAGTGRQRVLTGLPSLAGSDGTFGTGIDGVSVAPGGEIFAVVASAGFPKRLPPSFRGYIGNLLQVGPGNTTSLVADLDAFEQRENPDHGPRDSNPYGVLALEGHQLVADAAGNTLLDVTGGRIVVRAVLPRNLRRAESVPTSVALGPDGAYYVGEFVGEPRGLKPRNGLARVFRIVPGQPSQVYATGFNTITGLAFGPDGSLYVTEFNRSLVRESPAGDVVRVAPDGTRSRLGLGKLFFPAGAAVDATGALYVSNWSTLPAREAKRGPFRGRSGQVVRFSP